MRRGNSGMEHYGALNHRLRVAHGALHVVAVNKKIEIGGIGVVNDGRELKQEQPPAVASDHSGRGNDAALADDSADIIRAGHVSPGPKIVIVAVKHIPMGDAVAIGHQANGLALRSEVIFRSIRVGNDDGLSANRLIQNGNHHLRHLAGGLIESA